MFPKTDLQHLAVTHSGGTTDYFYSPEKKRKCLVHISGVHGVEGHIGSLIQHEILKSKLSDLSFQVVLVHVVNPYGKAHSLRTNRNNVDLNRNVLSQYHIENPHFKTFEAFYKTGNLLDAGSIVSLVLKKGFRHATISAAGGQTDYPDSLFYAGHELQPELISLRETLISLIHPEAELSVLDVHSGLGRMGAESLIVDGFNSESEQEFFQDAFHSKLVWPGRTRGSYQAMGPVSQLLKNQWKCSHIFQEFGTYSPPKVLKALIHKNPEQMLETFFPKNPHWRSRCTELGLLRFQQLVQNLS
ncbi:MAG: M14 family metallopeptidase [Pseudobdellovibrionaceae bacterium]